MDEPFLLWRTRKGDKGSYFAEKSLPLCHKGASKKATIENLEYQDKRQQLNLPAFDVQVERRAGRDYIYDVLRHKLVRLTPEEWIRQHFVMYLMRFFGYPEHVFANEIVLPEAIRRGRTDSVVFGHGGKPWMLIEYKAAELSLTKDMWCQLAAYNLYYKVDYLCLANGVKQMVCRIDYQSGTYTFLPEVPHYKDLCLHYVEKSAISACEDDFSRLSEEKIP